MSPIWQQWFLLLGMAPDLKAVVLLRNISASCRSIMCNIRFCEEREVRFCMPVKIISNAKYGKINPMSYLSDEICNIGDSWCGDYTDCCLSCAVWLMMELGSSPEKEVKQYWTTGHHFPDNSRIWGMGNMCSSRIAVLFCPDTDKWQWPNIWYTYMFPRLWLLLFLLAAGGSSLARLSHSVINSNGEKILFPLRCSSQECNPNNQIYHSWMFNYIHTSYACTL